MRGYDGTGQKDRPETKAVLLKRYISSFHLLPRKPYSAHPYLNTLVQIRDKSTSQRIVSASDGILWRRSRSGSAARKIYSMKVFHAHQQ